MRSLLLSCFTAGVFAAAFADSPACWRFRWPALVPSVAEHDCEPTRRVVLDEGATVEVACGGDGAAAVEWVAANVIETP